MTQIHNDPAKFKDDATAGFLAAYERYVERVPNASAVMRRGGARAGKVGLVVGGGSGHYPAFCGLVGAGMADAAVIGDVFTSPSNEQAYRTARAVDGGAGLLFCFGNYAGDVMNFAAAQERLRAEGVDCRTILVTDDISSARADQVHLRRGIAGGFVVFKIAGAATERGDCLDDVERTAALGNARTYSFGVGFAGATMPGSDHPLFTVPAGSMELGLGIHGEPGITTVARAGAAELARLLVEPILAERPSDAGNRVALVVNGLGGTKYEELFVLYAHVAEQLHRAGLTIVLPEVGELVTSLDMSGTSVTVTWLTDELEKLWSAPADTPGFRRGSAVGLSRFAAVRRSASEERADIVGRLETGDLGSIAAAGAARLALEAMLAVVESNEQELARLDAVAGDGDHGSGMVRGMRSAVGAAHRCSGGVGATLRSAGLAFGDKAGGTSGMLWGVLLNGIGAGFDDRRRPTAADFLGGVVDGIDEMVRVGKAGPGDKTMMDVLFPFRDSLLEGTAAGKSLAQAWAEAAEVAALAGVATATMAPRLGRARPLAERSIGTSDPGAVSMSLCLRAVTPIIIALCERDY